MPSHGEFQQKPRVHVSGSGCIYCVNKTEEFYMSFLKNKSI